MNEYELMYILHPRLSADETSAAVDTVSEQVTSRGGEVLSVDNWGRRRMAYPIAGHTEGTYVLTTMRFVPDQTASLEAELRISEDVIRHLLIRGIIPYDAPPQDDARGRSRSSQPAAEAPPPPAEQAAPAPAADEESPAEEPETEARAAGAQEAPAAGSDEGDQGQEASSGAGPDEEGARATAEAE